MLHTAQLQERCPECIRSKHYSLRKGLDHAMAHASSMTALRLLAEGQISTASVPCRQAELLRPGGFVDKVPVTSGTA